MLDWQLENGISFAPRGLNSLGKRRGSLLALEEWQRSKMHGEAG